MASVITTRSLRKEFGTKVAVADLTIEVQAGEIFGFLGPNGAGKTTSVKMLLSLTHPTAGSATLLGQPLGDRLPHFQRHGARVQVGKPVDGGHRRAKVVGRLLA